MARQMPVVDEPRGQMKSRRGRLRALGLGLQPLAPGVVHASHHLRLLPLQEKNVGSFQASIQASSPNLERFWQRHAVLLRWASQSQPEPTHRRADGLVGGIGQLLRDGVEQVLLRPDIVTVHPTMHFVQVG